MSLLALNPRLARLLLLTATLQASTSTAYPHNYVSNSKAGTAIRDETTTPTNVIYQIYDGQVQASYSTTAEQIPNQSTIVITATTGLAEASSQAADLSTSRRSLTTGASFVSTTTEPCEETSSTPNASSPASSIPATVTSSFSNPTTSVAPPTTPSSTLYSTTTLPLTTSCGQPTPDVYISIIGSVPFVITGVACATTATSSADVTTQTSGIITVPMTVPMTTGLTTAMPSSTLTVPASTTRVPDSSLTSLTTSAIQTATITAPMSTNGSTMTSLETSGQPSSMPFPTASLTTATTSLSLINTSTMVPVGPTSTAPSTTLSATNVFEAIATDAPPAQISQTSSHPVPRLGIKPQAQKLQTNKFYSNFYLGSQTAPVFTYPYSVSWSAGGGETSSWGLAVSHTERFQLAPGSPKVGADAGEWAYFVNPIGIQSLVLSASELTNGTTLTTDSLEAFSVNVNLAAPGTSTPTITFPVLQGMSFITAIYENATPLLQSGVGIGSITFVGAVNNGPVFKYRATLNNGYTWLIYVTPSSTGYAVNSFTLTDSLALQGESGFTGTIQVAKLPANFTPQEESLYDSSAGTYPTAAAIGGNVSGQTGNYTIAWTKGGIQSQPLLTFALPHHLDSFSPETSAAVTSLELVTTTKGTGTAVTGDSWTLTEPDLPTSMGFAPWSPSQGEVKLVSDEAVDVINIAGLAELSQNVSQQTNTGTTYYDGKALAKFAAIVYALDDISGNASLALTGLQFLKDAFDLHVNNQMFWPLLYESAWGGIVESQTYVDGNSGDDFGNTYYNDHHFHYGYFVYAAAVIAHLDPSWLATGSNAAWVNSLVRDYANPSTSDPYYPFSRMFDWYHGHSWAAGLFESYDGKNQESSSEDSMSLYAIKMWGRVTGDASMEARGDLLLAVQARSLQHYYLMAADNAVQPAQFVGNKAAGIVFDNKIDHTTYFGADPSYIEGIHMLPLMPFSTLTRTRDFVAQEWAAYNWTDGGVGRVQGGWRGILMADYAIVDPVASYQFFSNATGDFDPGFLDGGASQTWYLAWAAALGGSN